MKSYLSSILFFLLISSKLFAQTNQWIEKTSPRYVPAIEAMAVNENTGRIYVHSYGAVYYSDNEGANWIKLNPANYYLPNVWSMAVNPTNGILYLGVVDNGIAWTDDNGATTWRRNTIQINPNSGLSVVPIFDITINPSNGLVLFGRYRCFNNPANLQLMNINSRATDLGAFAHAIAKNGDIYMIQNEDRGTPPIFDTVTGIYKSSNNGTTWNKLTLNISNHTGFLDMALDSADNIYFTTWAGIYRMNKGTTTLVSAEGDLPAFNVNASQPNKIQIDKSRNILYVLRNGLAYKSNNEGVTWQLLSAATDGGFQRCISVVPSGALLSGGSYTGVSIHKPSANILWEDRTSNLALTANYGGIRIDNRDNIYVINYALRLFKSTDRSLTWKQITDLDSATGFNVAQVEVASNDFVYATNKSAVWLSKNEGNSWANISYNLPNIISPGSLAVLLIDSTAYAWGTALSSNDIVLMKLQSNTWNILYNSASSTNSLVSVLGLFKMPTGRLVAVVGGESGFTPMAIFSDNNGTTWQETTFTNSFSGTFYEHRICQNPVTGCLYTDFFDANFPNTYFYKTDSTGLNWKPISTSFAFDFKDFAFDKTGALYAAIIDTSNLGGFGFIRTDNDFATYTDLVNNYPTVNYANGDPMINLSVSLSDIAFDSQKNVFTSAVNNIYEYTFVQNPTNIANSLNTNKGIRCYPNPTNNNLRIELEGIKEESVQICMEDMMGKLLLYKQDLAISSTGVAILSLNDFSNGIYILRVTTPTKNFTQKIQLLK